MPDAIHAAASCQESSRGRPGNRARDSFISVGWSSPLPPRDAPAPDHETRVRTGLHGHGAERVVPSGRAFPELAEQVRPLEGELTPRGRQLLRRARPAQLAAIEAITALQRFRMNGREVGVDGGDGIPGIAKPLQLRVHLVTPGSTAEHGSGQERFTPEGDESSRVEVFRVQGPEPHHAL